MRLRTLLIVVLLLGIALTPVANKRIEYGRQKAFLDQINDSGVAHYDGSFVWWKHILAGECLFDTVSEVTIYEPTDADIELLSEMTQMRFLEIFSYTGTRDISPLRTLARLEKLRIENCGIVKGTDALTHMTKLQYLSFAGTNLRDAPSRELSPLGSLPNLTWVNLFDTNITDLTPLEDLPNLTILDLRGSPVSDITPLASLTKLDSLYLTGTRVSDIGPLTSLVSLTSLQLGRTGVAELPTMSKMVNLEDLDLSDTQISDVTPLSRLDNLRHLDLSGTAVTDLTPISRLRRVQVFIGDRPMLIVPDELKKRVN